MNKIVTVKDVVRRHLAAPYVSFIWLSRLVM